MRRVFLLTIMSLAALLLFAQESIQIGTGSQDSIAPVVTQFNYTVSQMIYTSAELQEAGLTTGYITNLRFQAGSGNVNLTNTRFWNIRMKETTATNVDNWQDTAGTIEVYNQDHGVNTLPAGEWLDLTLTAPFIYSGTQNLLVQVMDMTPSFASVNRFGGHNTTGNLTRYAYRDAEPFNPTDNTTFIGEYATGGTATSTTRRPNIQIAYTPPASGPDLAVTAFTAPAEIPGTTPISITVINFSTTAASAYSVAIFEVDGSPVALYTVPTGSIIPLPNTFSSTVYSIDSAVYNQWAFVGVGNVTLQARVTIAGDLNTQNDVKTFETYILPIRDIQVTGFTGPGMIPTVHPFFVTLHNNGLQTLSTTDYTVKLYEAGTPDVEITTIAGVALPAEATETLTIDHNVINNYDFAYIVGNSTTLKVVVTLVAGDQSPADNVLTYVVKMFAGTTDAIVEVGLGGTNRSNELPVRLQFDDSYSQSIYRPADFAGLQTGMITHIMYSFNRTTNGAGGFPPDPYLVNVYMANYNGRPDGFTTNTDWVPHSQFTPVVVDYDLGLEPLAPGLYEIWIPLDTPFLYAGGDLVIMTYKDLNGVFITSTNGFMQTNNVAGSNISLTKGRYDIQGEEEFDPANVEIGIGNLITHNRYGFKPQMRFAFSTSGTTEVADMGVLTFTAPALIPSAPYEEITITIANLSSAVNVAATDYTIEIAEMVADLPVTLTTINSTTTPATVALAAGHTESVTLVIPSSIYNLWAYQSPAGAATLKAKIIYTADTNPANNEATAETALRPLYQIQLPTFTAPVYIPSADSIVVTVANNGRAMIAEAAYTVEIFQVYAPDTQHLLYKIGNLAQGAQVVAGSIGLADTVTYTIAPEVYNAWPYAPTAPTTFALKAVLTYNHNAQDFTENISLPDRQLGSQFDLGVLQLTGPALMPSFTPISVTVHNNGRASVAATEYFLKLYVGTTLLYTFGVGGNAETVAIDITEAKVFTVPAAAIRTAIATLPAGPFTFRAEIELAGDANPANNSITLDCVKSDMLTDGIAEVGIANNSPTIFGNNGVLPFDGFSYDSISQSIYTNADLADLESGIITHINYRFFRGDSNLSPGTVNIYFANAHKPSGFTSTTDWVPYSNFVLVKAAFDVENTSLPAGLNEVWIQLDATFTYTGQDLVIMTHKESATTYSNNDGFYQTEPVPNSNISLYRSSNSGNYNVQDPAASPNGTPTYLQYKPQMRFAIMVPSTGADIAITDFTGTPIIPGTQPLLITVQNTGNSAISAATYSIAIYEGEGTSPLYTLPGTAELPDLSDIHEYSISASVYNAWAYQGAEGAVTLKAVINFANDSNPANNTATFQTTLRPIYDIHMLSATGPAMFPAINPLQITLQNNGRAIVAAQSYSIEVSIGTTTIYTIPTTVIEEIGLGETKIYSIPTTTINPLITAVPNNFTLTLMVATSETEVYTNNNSATIDATYFSGFVTDGIAEIGIEGLEESIWVPLAFRYPTSISQSIYHASYFQGLEAGYITHINYTAHIADDIQLFPVTMYMANYNKTSFTDDYNWVPGSAFTLVANRVNLPFSEPGLTSVWIELDTPFFYTGGDLIVMPYREEMDWYFWSNFIVSPVITPNISMFQRDENDITYNPLNLSNVEGERRGYLPQTRFAFSLGEYGLLSGNAVFAGVVVAQGERAVTSNANGEYAIHVDLQDPTPITFIKEGYDLVTLNINDIQWEPQPQGLPTATYHPTMIAIGAVLVSGMVTLADTGQPIQSSVTVHIGSLSGVTTNGAYSIGPLYPFVTYPVSITLSDNTFYNNFTSQLHFTLADVVGSEYTYNITITESITPPPYAYATYTPTGGREVSWFSPLAEEEAIGLYVPTGDNWSYSEMTDAVFAHKYSAQRIGSMGLVGSYLTAVSFLPRHSDQEASIVIWVGEDLSEADVDNPTFQQPITTTIYVSMWNTVALNRPILVPENSELLVGIRSVETVLWVYDGGNASFVGAGNIIYIDNYWTDLINLTEGADGGPFHDDWAIRSSFIRPFPEVTTRSFNYSTPAKAELSPYKHNNMVYTRMLGTDVLPQPPSPQAHRSGNTRYFLCKYNIFRLPEGTTFNPDASPLSTVQNSNFMPTFIDDDEVVGRYNYVVTAVHEGDAYPQAGMQSAPTYTNYLNVSPWYDVAGAITRTNGTVAGFEVTLTNQTQGEYSPATIITDELGFFMFLVPAGSYLLTVHLDGVNADGEPHGIYSRAVIVTGSTSIPPIDMTAHSDADEAIMPMVTALQGNYPNPFNPTTTIAFALAQEGLVTIEVFNIKGQKVNTVANDNFKAGKHSVVWNGDDAQGKAVGSGVYFYRMQTTDFTHTKKALLLK